MEKTLSNITKLAKQCNCGQKHYNLDIERIVISRGALNEVVSFLEEKSLINIVIVVDRNTYDAAGEVLTTLLKDSGVKVSVCFIKPDERNDVVANEESIIQLMLVVSKMTDCLLAVGAGTIHDIARFVSYKMEKPFISIPTAPSVDGFTSMGAPLVIKGIKTTYQTHAPIAVFADLGILINAPKKMIAAGFGDMLGKSTSLADWQFSHLVGGEPFCPLVYHMTKEALDDCITNLDLIAAGDEKGIKILVQSLINSGIAMLLMGHSYPASGAEHHLSHYWEMDFIRNKKAQVLHGAKVSISCYLIADFYKSVIKNFVSKAYTMPLSLVDENVKKVIDNKEEIIRIINSIPEPTKLKDMVGKLGGETEPIQLGIEADLVQRSFKEAHLIRDRFTLLYFYNHFGGFEHASTSTKVWRM